MSERHPHDHPEPRAHDHGHEHDDQGTHGPHATGHAAHDHHAHGGHDGHAHHHHADAGPRLIWALLLTLGFAAVEAVAGFWSGSLALLGDAGHMVTDSASLALAAFAAWIAKRPPTQRHTYGYGRVETLAALANVVFMVAVVVGISVMAVRRILEPGDVNGEVVTIVAALGLLLNIGVAWLLMHGEQTMNTRGALLHVLGDLLGSVAALVSGAVIMWTGWTTVDPLLSLLICALMLVSSLRLLREVLQALMEGVPVSLSTEQVGRQLAGVRGVASVHDLHIWTLSSNRIALSAHLVVESLAHWPAVLAASRQVLAEQGITHVTLQPEPLHNAVRWLAPGEQRGVPES
ncbi:MAG: Cadmium, cobalt and zinc/H(+)-K(+) antiporter [Candidatus Accumulibacter regalis]|jgi:cobalt-zinc-cadmium efflux system protein|uniref:Cadmium, cobalt and zinc/H(+)-K(+) antiporter n=1 Tax=Accumulibacter regalis TaxID=522306 RepID=A0A011QCP6_ACCRE|nr:cation diffusion facilitator family transporter [Accumulibacter sp.]EXI87042.1 MAG: Cadmium, cobalt and zinc/H(+)-K(+) antiporter [Candidatus Accumulibacter regalis]MBL8368330.1 cation transporter [Accumulibacter sp.]MBN8514806.1 cation transporter [Accumulibacter sp.]HRE70504.1 cation diffusion facilitator family transporter [Accumulibacter sp.]HRE85674.1 cation diffusion facilitator family transporter [Accumulibacter sp.]